MEHRNISGKKLRLVSLYIIIFFGLILFSCKGKEQPQGYSGIDYFIKQNDIGLFVDNNNIFIYNDIDCQIAFNKGRKMLRLQRDEQLYYVNIVFPFMPNMQKEVIEVEIDYRTQNDKRTTSLQMRIVKTEDEKYWLWNDEVKTGVILPVNYAI